MQDDVHWEKSIKMNSAANSIVKRNYSTVDDVPFSGLSYYQLKQTDFDGRVFYSPVKTVRIKFSNTVKIYPNPTQFRITVKGNSCEPASIIWKKDYPSLLWRESLHFIYHAPSA